MLCLTQQLSCVAPVSVSIDIAALVRAENQRIERDVFVLDAVHLRCAWALMCRAASDGTPSSFLPLSALSLLAVPEHTRRDARNGVLRTSDCLL